MNGPSGHPPPRRRVVLLGASNLTRGISTVVETVQLALGHPLEFLVAMGHGRSFGAESCVFGKKIPGIFSCGLWRDLKRSENRPTSALVTDIGNDIVYGASVEQVFDWVDGCFDRLQQVEAEVVVTRLPIDSVEQMSEWKFRLMRRLLFPASRLTLDEVVSRAIELDQRVVERAISRKIGVIPVKQAWFGVDPIHIRRRHWSAAWHEIIAHWPSAATVQRHARGSLSRRLYLRCLAPEQCRILGFERRRQQPSGRLSDGSTVALY